MKHQLHIRREPVLQAVCTCGWRGLSYDMTAWHFWVAYAHAEESAKQHVKDLKAKHETG